MLAFWLMRFTPKKLHFDGKQSQLLVEVVVQITGDSASLVLLRVDQSPAEFASGVLGLPLLGNVDANSKHTDRVSGRIEIHPAAGRDPTLRLIRQQQTIFRPVRCL